MLIRIISLVVLFISSTTYGVSYSQSNDFIIPKKKPSIFKKIDEKKNNTTLILPSNKPIIDIKDKASISSFTMPVKKPINDQTLKEKAIIKKSPAKDNSLLVNITNQGKFIYPEKKPSN